MQETNVLRAGEGRTQDEEVPEAQLERKEYSLSNWLKCGKIGAAKER